MVVEYVRYEIPEAEASAFERAYAHAQMALEASANCLAWEVTRCIEDPTMWTVRLEWDSIEGHMQGFRHGPEFRAFFASVRPFVPNIQEMRHYEVTPIAGRR